MARVLYTSVVIEIRAFSLGLILSVALVYLLLLIVISRLDREPGFWALQSGSLAGFFGVLLVMLQGVVPTFMAFVLGNGLAVLTLVFFAHGITTWIARQPVPRTVWLLPLVMMGAGYWYGVVDPQVGPRILVFNGLLLTIMVPLGLFLWRQTGYPKTLLLPMRWLALAAFWLAAMGVLRMLAWLVLGLPEHSLLEPDWQVVLPYVGQLVGLVVFVVLITALLFSSLVEQLRLQATLDPLTQVLNRQGLRDGLEARWHDERLSGHSCGLMMLDLDRFKQINDRYGHEVGDRVLCHLADTMRRQAGADDLLARMGGEEFALVSFSADPAAQAEAICKSLEQLEAGDLPACTVSIGLVPDCPLSAENIRDAFRRADSALYQAKSNGRNRVEILSL